MRFIESGRRITQEVAQFHEKEKVSNWLWHTLQLYYAPQTRSETERDDFREFWDVHDNSVSAIGHIYYGLQTEEQKLLFRQGIGNTLTQLAEDKDASTLAMLRDLIYLIARTKAVESVNALVPTVNGLVGKTHPDILSDAMATLQYLSPSPEVQTTTKQLVDNPNFDNGYILTVIEILAQCEPSDILNLLTRFQPRINKLRIQCKELGGNEWDVFLKGAENLIEKLQKLKPTINTDEARKIIFG